MHEGEVEAEGAVVDAEAVAVDAVTRTKWSTTASLPTGMRKTEKPSMKSKRPRRSTVDPNHYHPLHSP